MYMYITFVINLYNIHYYLIICVYIYIYMYIYIYIHTYICIYAYYLLLSIYIHISLLYVYIYIITAYMYCSFYRYFIINYFLLTNEPEEGLLRQEAGVGHVDWESHVDHLAEEHNNVFLVSSCIVLRFLFAILLLFIVLQLIIC